MKLNINLKLKDIFSVPNLISLFRIMIIPVIIWVYCYKESGLICAVAVAVSGLSDIVDGKIARKFNMITDVGKVLDPIADKLTQAAMMYCLLRKYELMSFALAVLIAKELFLAITALMEAKVSQQVNGALMCGKICTTILYSVVLILLFFPKISLIAANILILISIAAMVYSAVAYGIYRFKIIRNN